ncbi:MAG: EAL domain-containing protein [Methylococcales bacterium]|jgi:diguanylate cyclase (GGDEF)-like protein|nr:EAL domain-containing protein [Methylococcales bacterium]MBT7445711.1 EAL domain-containing protein [Methylococcales bacterium]
MTLYRQLTISVSLLLVVMLIGTLAVNIHTTRTFLQGQLSSHAQDTATSLGLSLSQYSVEEDVPIMTSMVDAIFDRGYYEQISLTKVDGSPFIEKNSTIVVDTVPQWVINSVAFEAPSASAKVMSGWTEMGTVTVTSHAGYAYQEFWQTAVRLAVWFLLGAVVSLAILGLGVKVLFRPLQQVKSQADAVANKTYELQTNIPATKELKSVVLAMNQMTTKVQSHFLEQANFSERMREMAYQDATTGLGNRRYFISQLENRITQMEPGEHGVLILIQLVGLQTINDTEGFEAGDAYIKGAADLLVGFVSKECDSLTARLAGADFAVYLRQDEGLSILERVEELSQLFCELHQQGYTPNVDVSHIGSCGIKADSSVATILSEADLALRVAQGKGHNQWHIHSQAGSELTQDLNGRQAWGQFIREIIATESVLLHAQNVVKHPGEGVIHQEILVRILDKDNQVWPAGVVLPMAEQFKLVCDIDQIIIKKLIVYLNANPGTDTFAVNLCTQALSEDRFVAWLNETLQANSAAASRMIFEFSEFGAVRQLDALKAFSANLRRLGCGFGLDHFGQAFTSFGYLNSLKPDYVKIDGGYIAHMVDCRDDQFFVESLCHVAHSLDIVAIAERVETEEQAKLLSILGVDAIQGYLVHKPEGL